MRPALVPPSPARAARATFDGGLPRDAYVQVEVVDGDGDANAFAARIGDMYKGWAEKRRMQLEVLAETPVPYRLLIAVSGFGAYSILQSEAGLHVLEGPGTDGRPLSRVRASVRVVGQPNDDPQADDHVSVAERALADARAANIRIVRRYRELPSPLVRDSVRGWRSGRIDLVLGGDFDLVGR